MFVSCTFAFVQSTQFCLFLFRVSSWCWSNIIEFTFHVSVPYDRYYKNTINYNILIFRYTKVAVWLLVSIIFVYSRNVWNTYENAVFLSKKNIVVRISSSDIKDNFFRQLVITLYKTIFVFLSSWNFRFLSYCSVKKFAQFKKFT